MEYRRFQDYLKAIEPIKCQETLLNINATIYPHLKDSRRKSLFQTIKNTAKHGFQRPRKKDKASQDQVLSTIEGLAKVLQGGRRKN